MEYVSEQYLKEQENKISSLQVELTRYKRLLELAKDFKNKSDQIALKNHMAAMSLESELDMNSILTAELEAKDQEITRLRELIWKTFLLSVCDLPESEQQGHWETFKKENGLPEALNPSSKTK